MSGFEENEQFLDIHGREIPTTAINNEPVCFFDGLKQTGVGILKKSQYNKLSSMEKDFGPEFLEFMLESAKTYMLANKISFSQEQIKNCIENCKQTLSGEQPTQTAVKTTFLQNRQVEKSSNNDFSIKVSTPPSTKTLVSNITKKTPNLPPREPENESSSSDAESLNRRLKYPKKGAPNKQNDPVRNGGFSKTNADAPKLRPPKSRLSYNMEAKELDVIVTAVDKANCVWVRDLADYGLFEQVHERANNEAAMQKAAPRPWQKDKLYLAMDEDSWFRCKPIKSNPLTVFFLDYGNYAEVDEIREASEDLSKVPPLAMRITFKETEFNVNLEDEIRIKLFAKNDDGTYFVNIKGNSKNTGATFENGEDSARSFKATKQQQRRKTTQFEENRGGSRMNQRKNNRDRNRESDVEIGGREVESSQRRNVRDEETWEDRNLEKISKPPSQPEFIGKPSSLTTLENDQKVVIIHEENSLFYLRTKECFAKLKEIEIDINQYFPNAQTLTTVKPNQVVLYENPTDKKLYRAVVLNVNPNGVEVELLDYVATVDVDIATLKTINEKLSKEPLSIFCGGKLEGFEDEPFNDDCRKVIQEYIKTRKKFVVTLGFDEMDLYDGKQLLSTELKNIKKSQRLQEFENDRKTQNKIVSKSKAEAPLPNKISLKDIKPYKPEIGAGAYICGYFRSSTDLAIVPKDELTKHIDFILKADIEDKTPYAPSIGEVCLCFFVDSWYRCVVLNIFDKENEVLLIDFGNIELIRKEDLRRPDPQITDIHALALPCVLVGLPAYGEVEEILKKFVIDGEIYNVDIKNISDGKCQVEIPSVYKQIEKACSL